MQIPEYTVYQNLFVYMKYRGYESSDQKIERGEFNKMYERDGHFQIFGTLGDSQKTKNLDRVIISMLNSRSRKSQKSQEFKIHLAKLEKQQNIDEVILVVPESTFEKSHMYNLFNVFKKNSKKIFRIHKYSAFILNIPECICVPKHEIAKETDVKEFLIREHIKVENLPLISVQDPPIVWLGGNAGQVVKIFVYSQTCGKSVRYRLIKEFQKV